MFKRIATLLLAVVLLVSCSVFSVNAYEEETEESGIMPFLAYINSATTNLSISSAGTATCTGSITGYQGTTTKVEIYLYLEQYKNSVWSTVSGGNWYSLYSTYKGTLQKTKSSLTSGYKYRVRAAYYAYQGSKTETLTRYSGTVTY